MKKIIMILALVLTATCLFGVVGCKKGANKDGIVDVTTKTVTVGYTDYAPMNYEEKGVLKGFDTELALMTFNALGYDVRFKLIEWKNKYVELESGTIDCIWNGFTANSSDEGVARSEKVNFTAYYLENNQCVVSKSGNEATSQEDFVGKSIAYESGSAGQGYVDGLEGINVYKKGLTSQLDAIMQVNNGTSDYAVVDKTLAENYAGKGNYTSLVINEQIAIDIEYYAVGFAKTSAGAALRDKVNVMFEAFEETGVLLELATKYNLQTRLIEIDF